MGKRFFDLIVSAVALLVLAPVFLLIALAIRADSPGPVFFRGVRIGRYGRPFRIFKFRTMVLDAEKLGGTSTGKEDPRVTRVGRFLRRTKLDELPNLINVFRGEMSLVGPRPEVEEYTRLYDSEEQAILSVRPGITDEASVQFFHLADSLGSEDVDRVYAERIRPIKNQLRVKYVKERSFSNDVRILVRTLRRWLGGRS